jgi:hypothetical protein
LITDNDIAAKSAEIISDHRVEDQMYDTDSGIAPSDVGESTEKQIENDDSDESDQSDGGQALYITVNDSMYEYVDKMKIKINGEEFPQLLNKKIMMFKTKFWIVDELSENKVATSVPSSVRAWIDQYLYESSALKEKADRRYDLVCKI